MAGSAQQTQGCIADTLQLLDPHAHLLLRCHDFPISPSNGSSVRSLKLCFSSSNSGWSTASSRGGFSSGGTKP